MEHYRNEEIHNQDSQRGVNMKKLRKVIILIVIFIAFVCLSSENSHAQNNFDGNPLVVTINFDPSSRVLSGKTAAYANISLLNTAITAVADANGDYQLPIPTEMNSGDVQIFDIIGDQRTTITYDFVDTAAPSTPESSSTVVSSESSSSEISSEVSSTTSAISSSSSEETSSTSRTSSSTMPTSSNKLENKDEDEPTGPPVFLIVLIVGCIIVLGILVYFSFIKPNKDNKRQ